jgi:hypothetical protein
MLRLSSVLAAALVVLAVTAPAPACPFCSEGRGPTLVGDFANAQLVMLGAIGPAKLGTGDGESATEFTIEQVLKPNDYVKDKKKVILPRFVPPTKNKFLVFCDVYKGNLDPYRGIEVAGDEQIVKYLVGAVKLTERPAGDRLRYCFDYLNSTEFEVAVDAYREFAKADYKDYMTMAKSLPADTIVGWLRDAKTPTFRLGLYASLLGHCGSEKHAGVLKEMLDDPEKRKSSSIDGILAGYVMLQPKAGWEHLKSVLSNPKEEFLMRYAVLRTMRFLWDQRPDLVDREEIVRGASGLLTQGDMADFAIEDLRKWHRWEKTDAVLDLFGQKTHDIPVVKRAILRFALQSPSARAKTWVAQQRQRDADWVKDAEELLKLESDSAPTPTAVQPGKE